MTQTVTPSQDIFNLGWTPLVLFSELNEEVPDDSTYVESPDNPTNVIFEVKFPSLAWPQPGPQILTVRLMKNTSAPLGVSIALLQGTRIIAPRTIADPAESFTNVAIQLTATEVSQITDYTDLRVRVIAGYVLP